MMIIDEGWYPEHDKNSERLFTFSKTNWKVHEWIGAWEWKVGNKLKQNPW